MKSVEITTAQNVDIEFEVAGAMERFVAFLLDAIVLILIDLLLAAIIFSLGNPSKTVVIAFCVACTTFCRNILLRVSILGRRLWG